MRIFNKDLAQEVAIIAEIGVNHEGNVDAASRMLRLAAEAGADAVKFQSYTPVRYAATTDAARFARVTRFALDREAHQRLAREAAQLNVAFMSSALSEDWVPFLDALCPVHKIASGDLTFEPVIRSAAATGKPIILSVGLGTVDEVDRAVSWIRDEIAPTPPSDRLVLMHCVSAYPTPIEHANILSVRFLADRYRVPVGYSNHVIGPEACWAAIALGASVIEVHFTDCKSGRDFRDHEMAFEADDLAALVKAAPRLRASLGRYGKERQASELGLLDAIRKKVVAARDLPAGTVLGPDQLMFARATGGFTADRMPGLLGRKLRAALGAGEPVVETNLED